MALPKGVAFGIVATIALIPSILMLLWIFFGFQDSPPDYYFSGLTFKWDDPAHYWTSMNWHPLLMTISFGSIFSTAACAFKTLPFSHNINKMVHMALQTSALILSTAGIAVVLTFKEVSGNHNFYTGHAWLGLAAYTFFVVQWFFGFISFFFPKLPDTPRALVHPFHIFFGFLIYVMTMGAIWVGVTDREVICGGGCGMSSYGESGSYSWIGGNLIILSLILVAGTVFWVHRPPTDVSLYKKVHHTPLGEDERGYLDDTQPFLN